MSEKAIWIVKVRGKEMEKNFEKIIKEGISIDDNLKTELSKKLPNIEEFIENGKIRFWRFVKGKKRLGISQNG